MVKLSDYVIQRIAEAGVKHVFFVPGGAAMHLNDSLGRHPDIQYVSNLHEQASAMAAETYAKATGGLSVTMVTAGPGATNAITGLTGAWLDSTPVLFLSGQVKTADLKGDSGVRQMGVQEVDAVSIVSPLTKYAVTVTDPQSIRFHLEKALYLARSGRPGPVWIEIPLDVQATHLDPDTLECFVFVSEDAGQTGELSLTDAVHRVADLLSQAKRPLILAGHGVRLAGALPAFEQLIERWNIPVLLTWLAADFLPDEHPLCIGRPGSAAPRGANFALQNCDLLLAIGTRLDLTITGFAPQNLARGAHKVMVDVDAAELEKLRPYLEMPIQADAGEFLGQLKNTEASFDFPAAEKRWESWHKRCHEWKKRYPIVQSEHRALGERVSVYYFSEVMGEVSTSEDWLVSGSSGIGIEIFQLAYKFKKGQRLFHTTALGSMGNALPATIGASLGASVQGGRRIICVDGDGGFFFNVQELATIANLNANIKIFVFNNDAYASIRSTQVGYFNGNLVGCDERSGLKLPDICTVAQAFGLQTARITTAENLAASICAVLALEGPVVCEVLTPTAEIRAPRIATVQKPDGSMFSKPLEDLWPFLDRDEFAANMIVEPLAE